MRTGLLLSLTAVLIVAFSALRAEEEFVIGVRQEEPAPVPEKPKEPEPTEFANMLGADLKEREYQDQILKIVQRIKKGNLSSQESKDIETSIGNSAEKSAKALVALLNWDRTTDVYTRLAVLEAMKFNMYVQDKVVGGLIGASAMSDRRRSFAQHRSH
ncbi:MAG TPA: hypothetical protein VEJ63_08380 [Planctomycetota bacterium]|nr:hypothetical protein [Planctomycetota bacterium]